MKKGLLCWVYRYCEGDSTNGGISSKHNRFILIGDSVSGIFEADEKTPALYLIRRTIRGREILQASPFDDGRYGMFGGNFIYSCDTRFPSDFPIKIMDRFE